MRTTVYSMRVYKIEIENQIENQNLILRLELEEGALSICSPLRIKSLFPSVCVCLSFDVQNLNALSMIMQFHHRQCDTHTTVYIYIYMYTYIYKLLKTLLHSHDSPSNTFFVTSFTFITIYIYNYTYLDTIQYAAYTTLACEITHC